MKLTEVTDSRPLIWSIAAQQIAKGKKINYRARNGRFSVVNGWIETVYEDRFSFWDTTIRAHRIFWFNENGDSYLTMGPPDDPELFDFTITDAE